MLPTYQGSASCVEWPPPPVFGPPPAASQGQRWDWQIAGQWRLLCSLAQAWDAALYACQEQRVHHALASRPAGMPAQPARGRRQDNGASWAPCNMQAGGWAWCSVVGPGGHAALVAGTAVLRWKPKRLPNESRLPAAAWRQCTCSTTCCATAAVPSQALAVAASLPPLACPPSDPPLIQPLRCVHGPLPWCTKGLCISWCIVLGLGWQRASWARRQRAACRLPRTPPPARRALNRSWRLQFGMKSS